MIQIAGAQLDAWLAAFVWPLARVLGLMVTAPILGDTSVPATVKIALSVLIALAVSATLPPLPAVAVGSFAGLAVLVMQTLIGIGMGFAMRLMFAAVEMAGNISSNQMGLGFATLFDPESAGTTTAISSFMNLLATLLFLALDGHLLVLSVLTESFQALPIAADPLSAGAWMALARSGGQIFLFGLTLSMPIVAALLITNLALGILTRAAPQLNIFAVGFPVTLAVGLLMLALSLPYLTPALEQAIRTSIESMGGFARPQAGTRT